MLDAAAFHDALDRGDHRAAASWLVRAHAGDVLSFCRTLVRDAATAEDLAQDTFANAFGGLAGLRLESSPRTWLLAIARHRCIDHLRRHKRAPFALAAEPEWVEHHPDDEAPPGPELIQRRDDVTRALSVLDEPSRALVMLRFRHGLDYPELAEVFGQKEGALRMRLSRALARMRQELGEEPRLARELVASSTAAPASPAASRGPEDQAPRAPAAPAAARPAPAAPPPAAAAPPDGARSGGLPPPRRRSLFGLFSRRTQSPPPPLAFPEVLAKLDDIPDAFVARLELLAGDLEKR